MSAVGGGLGGRHGQPQEEVVIGRDRLDGRFHALSASCRYLEQRRKELACKQQRRCRVAAVQLVAHVQRALHDGLERNATRGSNRFAYDRRHDVLDVQEALFHAFVVDAVIQAPRIGSFIEIAVCEVAPFCVPDHQNGHGGGIDARERSHAIEFAARRDPDLATGELFLGFFVRSGQDLRTARHLSPRCAGRLRNAPKASAGPTSGWWPGAIREALRAPARCRSGSDPRRTAGGEPRHSPARGACSFQVLLRSSCLID